MRLSRALKEKMMDVRVRDKFLNEGKITRAQVTEFLSTLPDDDEKLTFTDKVEEGKKPSKERVN
jgi:hypothetical protein